MGDRGVGGRRLGIQGDKFVAAGTLVEPLPLQDDAEAAQKHSLQLDGLGGDRQEPLLEIDRNGCEVDVEGDEVFVEVADGRQDA
jgi:hypothetical protein